MVDSPRHLRFTLAGPEHTAALPRLAALCAAEVYGAPAQMGPYLVDTFWFSELVNLTYVALQGDVVVGYIAFEVHPLAMGGHEVVSGEIYMLPEVRRPQAAWRFMCFAREDLIKIDVRQVRMWVPTGRPTARLLAKMGFAPAATLYAGRIKS